MPAQVMSSQSKAYAVQRFGLLYETTALGYHVVFNAKADIQSMVILNEEEYSVFQSITGLTTQAELLTLLEERFSEDFVVQTLTYLEAHHIIHQRPREPRPNMTVGEGASLWVHVTNQCNLRCTYCYIDKTQSHLDVPDGQLYLETALTVLAERGVKRVRIKYAGGEPMMRFEELIALNTHVREFAKTLNLELDCSILTNGTLLTPQRAQRLATENIHLGVSLDGLEATHDENRPFINGKGSVQEVLNGIALLQEAGASFGISVVVTPGNISSLPALVQFCLERNIAYNIYFARENPFSLSEIQPDNDRLIEGMRGVYNAVRKNFPSYTVLEGHLDQVSFKRAHELPACGVDYNYIVMSETGTVSSCQMLIKKPVGSILDHDVAEKLFGAKTLTEGALASEKEGCESCTWRYLCAGGCPALTQMTYGTSKKSSPFCATYKALIPELIQLEAERIITLGQQLLSTAEPAQQLTP